MQNRQKQNRKRQSEGRGKLQEGQQAGWQDWLALLAKANTPELVEELMELFLTFSERSSLNHRVALIRALLEKKETQREISHSLGISIAKITSGSNALKIAPDELLSFLREHFELD